MRFEKKTKRKSSTFKFQNSGTQMFKISDKMGLKELIKKS